MMWSHGIRDPRLGLCLAAMLALALDASAVQYRGKGGEAAFGLAPGQMATDYTAQEIDCGGRSNVFLAGDEIAFTVQFGNATDAPLAAAGRAEIIAYSTTHEVGNMWWGQVLEKGAVAASVPIKVALAAKGYADVRVVAKAPKRYGGYAVVVDLPGHGRQFVAAFVYVPTPTPGKVQYPAFAMDIRNVTPESCTLWQRLGMKATRLEVGYTPTTGPNFPKRLEEMDASCQLMAAHEIAPLLTLEGGDTSTMPMGVWRSFLNDQDEGPMTYPGDAAWEPKYDPDFRKWVALLAGRYGWPKGPVNAVELWNEPWDGASISGWGADIPRYREIYTAMAEGVEKARAQEHVQVLIGGCCSSMNTEGKLFSDGNDTFLKWLDFTSIHYQPLDSIPALIPAWMERKSPYGPVRPWDTETWMANCDDRVSAVLASMRATGLERTAGVFHDMVFDPTEVTARTATGPQRVRIIQVWSTAASVAANQALLGERTFKEILFKNGLPWVFVFNGLKDNPDDGVVVVVGDLGAAYGRTQTLFHSVLGLSNVAKVAPLRAALEALPPDAPKAERDKLQAAVDEAEVLTDGRMTLSNQRTFELFDIYGNRIPASWGKLTLPLNGKGYYLRTNGARGSFARLLAALQQARIDGYQPVEILARDMLAPIGERPAVRLILTNILNRPVSGTLTAQLGALTLDAPRQELTLAPHETRTLALTVTGGAPRADNSYALAADFDAGRDGTAAHREDMHCNVIVKRTITVDGKLDDWNGVPPQPAHSDAASALAPSTSAWLPAGTFDTGIATGWSISYLAYDKQFFYFAAKVADSTPDNGDIRFATRDDDQYFYPETCYRAAPQNTALSVRWLGKVTPQYSEEYTFYTVTDDGARLWVNGQQLVNDWQSHADTENAGKVTLEAGKPYDLKLEYYDGGGGATTRLLWSSASQPKQVIPATALTPESETQAGGLTGYYFRGTGLTGASVKRVDGSLDFHLDRQNTPAEMWPPSPPREKLTWPAGVRRFSYRKWPQTPFSGWQGGEYDSVQIAFNVLPASRKSLYEYPRGTMPHFMSGADTDYEYFLHKVDPQYGVDTEVWRLYCPGMPRKHFFPRQPKSEIDGGPVANARLAIVQEGNTRIMECALPWAEIPDVKQALDRGETIKFAVRTCDAKAPTYYSSQRRSVARRNYLAFHGYEDWANWSNDIEFAFGK